MKHPPFTKSHVLNITGQHIIKDINYSIRKTHNRLQDIPEKGQEIIETIDVLYRWLKMNEDFMAHNPQLFEEGKDEEY